MGDVTDYIYTQNEYGWKYVPAQYAVDDDGKVVDLIGPDGNPALFQRDDGGRSVYLPVTITGTISTGVVL
jgi:hypothetical protein